MPKFVKCFQSVAVLLSWGFISSLACNNQYSGKRIKRTVLVIGVCAIALQIAVQYSLFTYLETTKDLNATTHGKYRPFNCTATSYVHRQGVSQKLTNWTFGWTSPAGQYEHVDVKEFFEILVADENLWVSLSKHDLKSGDAKHFLNYFLHRWKLALLVIHGRVAAPDFNYGVDMQRRQ